MITFNNVKVFQVLDSAEGKEFYSYTDSNIDFVITDSFLEELKNNSEYGDSDSEITALMNKYFAEASPYAPWIRYAEIRESYNSVSAVTIDNMDELREYIFTTTNELLQVKKFIP